jgi:hypothetical protein
MMNGEEDSTSDESVASTAIVPYYAKNGDTTNEETSWVLYPGADETSIIFNNVDNTSIVPYSVANSSVNPADSDYFQEIDIEDAMQPPAGVVPELVTKKKSSRKKRKKKNTKLIPQILLGLFTLFTIGVIGLGVTLYVFIRIKPSKDSSTDNNMDAGANATITPVAETSAPTNTTDSFVPDVFSPMTPVQAPTSNPTSAPVKTTLEPTKAPTNSTASPTAHPMGNLTSAPTSAAPTAAPTVDRKAPLVNFLETTYAVNFTDPDSPASMAVEWITQEGLSDLDTAQLAQRFAMVTLDYSLVPTFYRTQVSYWVLTNVHECFWQGVTCVDSVVTEIRLQSLDLPGKIPPEIGILRNLTSLDLSENQLVGSIPEELYEMTKLEKIFLYKNRLTGTLSPSIGNLSNVTHLHLSHNYLSGSLPTTMRSVASIKPYRK